MIIEDGNCGNNDDDQERMRSQINGWRRSLGPPAAKCATHHVCYCSRRNHSLWLKHIYHDLCTLLMTANVCVGSSLKSFSWLWCMIRFWANTSHHIQVDFFFSMFLCFLVFDDPHLFLYSSKIIFYFLSLFPPLIHLAPHLHDVCTAYCLYCHFLSYQLL